MSRVARKKRITAAYSLMDELMASSTNPMPEKMQVYQMTKIYEALNSLETAPVATVEDWRLVSDAVNMLETLVTEMQVCEDSSGLLDDAVNAMAKAGIRHLAGASLRLDAAGIQAARSVVEDYGLMLATLPHRTMVKCHRLTEKRIMEICSGNRKAHDVTVVNL